MPEWDLDSYGVVRVNDIIVGQVEKCRYGRGFVVVRVNETVTVSFPGRNAVFPSREVAAEALVGVIVDGGADMDAIFVCVTHRRFIPCRVDNEYCLTTDNQHFVDAVQRYQQGGDA